MIIILVAILGLVAGSFCNAVVWRLHSGESISKGRSMCPHCRHQLAARDLIPVLSWVSLKGKCRYCHKPIGVHYALVEIVTAGLYALTYVVLRPTDALSLILLAMWFLILAAVLILALYDAKWYLLPNKVMHPVLGLGVAYFAVHAVAAQNPRAAIFQLIIALMAAGAFYALWRLSDGKLMGGADSKLVLLMGLVLVPSNLLAALFVAFMLGGVAAAYLLITKSKGRHDMLPFGPFLIAGFIIAQLYGAQLVNFYVHTLIGG